MAVKRPVAGKGLTRSKGSPLGRPSCAAAIALPMDPHDASANAPSIRWCAIKCPSGAHTETLTWADIDAAWESAPLIARLASARLMVTNFP